MLRCTVANNTATFPGGIANGSGQVINFGGGIFNEGTLKMADCTIANNASGGAGGGICNSLSGNLWLANCTIACNTASQYQGGGIDNENPTAGVTFGNTIIASNSAGGSGADIYGYIQSLGSNLIGNQQGIYFPTGSPYHDPAGITGLQPSDRLGDPKLGPLQYNNGGPTPTMALLPGSQAINAGTNALAVDPFGNYLTTDQCNQPRKSGGQVDIGACESQTTTTMTTLIAKASLSAAGLTVTFTATVTGAALGSNPAAGLVAFIVDGNRFAVHVRLNGGVATYQLTFPRPAGPRPIYHTIQASYGGGTNGDFILAPSVSSVLTEVVPPKPKEA
jgi:hypothetical protein